MRSPSGTPASANCAPNRPATATATMPRGAIHPVSTRSCHVADVPIVARKIASGRTTNSTRNTNRSTRQSSVASSVRSSAAVSMMKRPDTRSTVTVSLNRRISVRDEMREFARVMPMTVTVSSPASWRIAFVPAAAAMMVAKSTGAFRNSGTQPRANDCSISLPRPKPPAIAITNASRPSNSVPRSWCSPYMIRIASNANTANSAPIGSFTIASHRRSEAGRRDSCA